MHIREERSAINNLSFHLRKLEKGERNISKISKRNSKRVEINKIKNRNSIKKINKTKSWFSENINTIDTSLANLTMKKRKDTNY